MINYEKVEKFFNDNYYVSSELLNYYTLRGINLINESKILDGQDIYAVCLDGPPGAGKSMYAKLYAQMVHNLLNTEVSLISYQCDDATSKIELFEDINVGAAVAGKSEKVNIPGVIARAILEANKGKKVILFIDEYDKSREQVDSLFLQFLQDGRINTNQFGDLEIKQEYKGNIQVIFCKNDFRTELTGPLTRRIRKINLKVIKPSDFMNLARRKFINNNNYEIVMPIIELVSLIYESVYENADYTRIPATSEMFGAIEDLIFLNKTKAPSNIVYNILIEDLFKNEDDRELFNSSLDTIENNTLKKILTTLKGNREEISIMSISRAIKDVFKAEVSSELDEERQKLIDEQLKFKQKGEQLENDYKKKEEKLFKQIEELKDYKIKIKQEFDSIISKKKEMVEEDKVPIGSIYAKNFDYTSPLIRRGENVFLNKDSWEEIATLETDKVKFDNNTLIDEFVKDGIVVYENGYLKTVTAEDEKIKEIQEVNFALVRVKREDNKLVFKVLVDKADIKEIDYYEVIDELLYKIIYINNSDNYKIIEFGQELPISTYILDNKLYKEVNEKIKKAYHG